MSLALAHGMQESLDPGDVASASPVPIALQNGVGIAVQEHPEDMLCGRCRPAAEGREQEWKHVSPLTGGDRHPESPLGISPGDAWQRVDPRRHRKAIHGEGQDPVLPENLRDLGVDGPLVYDVEWSTHRHDRNPLRSPMAQGVLTDGGQLLFVSALGRRYAAECP